MASKTVASKTTSKTATAASTGDAAIRARVTVYPRPEILDPQGKAIHGALQRLGFVHAAEVRAGKSFEISLTGIEGAAAEEEVRQMCQRLLANSVVEDFTVELLSEGAA